MARAQLRKVGPVGIEPTTRGLKVRGRPCHPVPGRTSECRPHRSNARCRSRSPRFVRARPFRSSASVPNPCPTGPSRARCPHPSRTPGQRDATRRPANPSDQAGHRQPLRRSPGMGHRRPDQRHRAPAVLRPAALRQHHRTPDAVTGHARRPAAQEVHRHHRPRPARTRTLRRPHRRAPRHRHRASPHQPLPPPHHPTRRQPGRVSCLPSQQPTAAAPAEDRDASPPAATRSPGDSDGRTHAAPPAAPVRPGWPHRSGRTESHSPRPHPTPPPPPRLSGRHRSTSTRPTVARPTATRTRRPIFSPRAGSPTSAPSSASFTTTDAASPAPSPRGAAAKCSPHSTPPSPTTAGPPPTPPQHCSRSPPTAPPPAPCASPHPAPGGTSRRHRLRLPNQCDRSHGRSRSWSPAALSLSAPR